MNNTDYNLIGLTGPTGAGKSMAGKVFAHSGFAVVDADKIAHEALSNAECVKKLCASFSDVILNPDGTINRSALSKAAFSSKENTELLNSITHPVITEVALRTFRELSQKGHKNIVFDAPTLIEAGMDTLCRKIVCVLAPLESRLSRIMARDGITKEKALERINAQHPDSFYTDKSDYVIINNSDENALKECTIEIIKELL